MGAPDTIHLQLVDEDATRTLAERIAPLVQAGDCLLLSGPIGAGKSFFARSAIQARLAKLGFWEEVPSPTFTLVQTYEAGPLDIWHCDLYRLASITDLDELGIEDAFENAATFIEWPDRLGTNVPPDALHLEFGILEPGEGRYLTIRNLQNSRNLPLVQALLEHANVVAQI